MTRLLFVANDLSPGGETSYIAGLSDALRTRGFSIGCITTEARGGRFDELSGSFDLLADLSAAPLGLRKLSSLVRTIRSFSPRFVLCSARVAHYALPSLGPETLPMAVLHLDNPNFYRRAARFPERVAAWICPTPRLAAGMRQLLPLSSGDRVKVVPHGVDRELFETSSQPIVGRTTDILFVGGLYEHKGVHWLPEIVRLGGNALANVRISLIGEGDLKQSLERKFIAMGTAAEFRGARPKSVVAAAMGATKVFLFPTQVEGFGLVLAEAMMAGAVPVCTYLEGITDTIVEDGRSGFLVPLGDVAMFASRTAQLLNEPSTWQSMSWAAQKRAQQAFSLEAMADRYEDLFRQPDTRSGIRKRSWAGWSLECAKQELSEGLSAGNLWSHVATMWGWRSRK